MTYLVTSVRVAAPLPGGHLLFFCPLAPLPGIHEQTSKYWYVALAGLAFVLAVDIIVVTVARRRAGRTAAGPARPASEPSPLRLGRVPLQAVAIAAAASITLGAAWLMQGYAMWAWVGMALIPWIPLVAVEAIWKYEHYGFWAIFGVAVLLQIGHMGEHTVQVFQLLIYNGRLAQSHGVFGALDFETIHFYWDSSVWVLLCVVLVRFPRGNKWLWVAFVASSIHEVEHIYLYAVYNADPTFYVHAGLAGIMGNGGVIGSPIARPYLHFAYNFVVIVPTVCAFLDQTKFVRARYGPSRGSPSARPVGQASVAAAAPVRWSITGLNSWVGEKSTYSESSSASGA
jgi:hypothetical protein